MQLDIKSLEQINGLKKQLDGVDEEIKCITKLAGTTAEIPAKNANRVITFTIDEDGLTPQANQRSHDGDMPDMIEVDLERGKNPMEAIFRGISEAMEKRAHGNREEKPALSPITRNLKTTICSETAALKILGILLIEKQEQKAGIIKQLEELGVKI